MYQVIDDVEYSINEAIGFPNDCKYWDVIEYWGNQLKEELQPAYFAFFDIDHLKKCFDNGEDHINHRYWTKDSLGNPMLAEQHVVMYRDLSNNDLLAITYVLDHTKIDDLCKMEAEQKRILEEDMNKISISSSHLLSLINDVLDMSRIESGRVKIEEKEVHLPDILHDLRTIIQSNIAAKQQDLFIDTQDIMHEDIITDKLRLNQVLLNIVGNAIKFTPVGGTISIRVLEKPSALSGYTTYEFRIKDNGIGMSEDFQKHIFESFTREQTGRFLGKRQWSGQKKLMR